MEALSREVRTNEKTSVDFRAEINAKLDQLLKNRETEAYMAGQRDSQTKVISDRLTRLEDDIKAIKQAQETDMNAVKEKQNEPKDKLLEFFIDIVKLVLAGAVGYFMHKLA